MAQAQLQDAELPDDGPELADPAAVPDSKGEPETQRLAWFIMAHLMLEPGARVLDVACGDGAVLHAMATLHPDKEFVGLERSRKTIRRAQEKYDLPNLQFTSGDIAESFIPRGSLDAVVNSFNLHETYSAAHRNEKIIVQLLQREVELLKPDGVLFIQDYARPEEEFILIEMPENVSGERKGPSDIDMLVDFSERAGPLDDDHYRGFYLEECPPRFPRTRLFRLPGKWAYEFILHKYNKDKWDKEIEQEYTFYTRANFRRTLDSLGLRVLYTAPHWQHETVKANLNKKIRLLDESGAPMGPPPTSFIAVAQKAGDKQSLILQERKPVRTDKTSLSIIAMRDEVSGRVLDVVSRDVEVTEILPYRVTAAGRLHVFVHESIPRALANAVPRNGPNLDGKQWSGHMTEALAVPQDVIADIKPGDFKALLKFSQNYIGLKPVFSSQMMDGPGFYPAPDAIDERIDTKYINVEKPDGPVRVKAVIKDIEGFSTRGRLRELDAQTVLNAIGVGILPSSRLELQILALYGKLGIAYESWAQCPLTIKTEEPGQTTKIEDIIEKLAASDHRFKESRGSAGQLKSMHSIFVDEGQAGGGVTGLASRDMTFILPEQDTSNIAVCLPLTRKINGEVMAGIVEQYLPVPERYKGNGYTVSCPSFPLPADVTNMELARKYVADVFSTKVDCVMPMGESYFHHLGVTPQRVYPFAVTTAGVSGWRKVGRTHGPVQFTPLYRLYRLLYLDNYYSFMKEVAMAYQAALGMNSAHTPDYKFSHSMVDDKSQPISLKGSPLSSSRPREPDA